MIPLWYEATGLERLLKLGLVVEKLNTLRYRLSTSSHYAAEVPPGFDKL